MIVHIEKVQSIHDPVVVNIAGARLAVRTRAPTKQQHQQIIHIDKTLDRAVRSHISRAAWLRKLERTHIDKIADHSRQRIEIERNGFSHVAVLIEVGAVGRQELIFALIAVRGRCTQPRVVVIGPILVVWSIAIDELRIGGGVALAWR